MLDWKDIIEEFCLDITVRGYSKITIKNYKCKLRHSAEYFKGLDISPESLTQKDIKKWILSLQEQEYQASTINIVVSRFKKLFDYMVDEGYIKETPFIRIKRLKEQKKIIFPFSDEEIKDILIEARKSKYKHIAQRDVVIMMLLVDCGLRISEVVNLKDSDILENQIYIRKSKWNKDRAVAISPILKKEIIKYNRIKKKKYGEIKGEPFIVSYQREKMNEKTLWCICQRIKKNVEVRDVVRFSPHTFRHTYAYMQIRNGLDIFTLSLNLGHSSVQMTQGYIQTLKSDDFIEKSVKASSLMNLERGSS